MKNFLTVFAIISLLSQPLLAQEQEQDSTKLEQAGEDAEQAIDQVEEFADRNLKFGFKAGLNFSSLNDNEILESDPQTGIHLGIFTRFQFSRRLSAKVELVYSSQGARSDQFSIFEGYSINLNYLTLPIMAEFMPFDNFRIELGPYIGVLVGSNQSFKDLQAPGGNAFIQTSSAETNFVDVGFGIGATYEFDSGFGLGVRYTQGFANALGNDFFGGASGSNSIFQPSIYYNF